VRGRGELPQLRDKGAGLLEFSFREPGVAHITVQVLHSGGHQFRLS
jgi:hypothetical protein